MIYLCLYFLTAYSPVNRTGSPQGLFTSTNLTQDEHKAKHAHYNYTHVKHIYQHNPKVTPFGIALVKIKKIKEIKLGYAGTIDRFGLAFQYQII